MFCFSSLCHSSLPECSSFEYSCVAVSSLLPVVNKYLLVDVLSGYCNQPRNAGGCITCYVYSDLSLGVLRRRTKKKRN